MRTLSSLPRDFRVPVALTFVGTSAALLNLLLLAAHGLVSFTQPYGIYVLGITALYLMTSGAACFGRWALFLGAGATLFTLNAVACFLMPGGFLTLLQTLSCPSWARMFLQAHGPLLTYNLVVLAFSVAGMTVFWKTIGARLRV